MGRECRRGLLWTALPKVVVRGRIGLTIIGFDLAQPVAARELDGLYCAKRRGSGSYRVQSGRDRTSEPQGDRDLNKARMKTNDAARRRNINCRKRSQVMI